MLAIFSCFLLIELFARVILDMSRRLNIVFVLGLGVFLFVENSILTIMYIFSFFWSLILQFMRLISDLLIFFGSVDFGGYLVVASFKR